MGHKTQAAEGFQRTRGPKIKVIRFQQQDGNCVRFRPMSESDMFYPLLVDIPRKPPHPGFLSLNR
jgi:hypothetical protein